MSRAGSASTAARAARTCASGRASSASIGTAGFADYVAVPASVVRHNDRAKLPPEIACLQEPFGNAVFATSTQEPSPGGRSQCRRAGRSALRDRDRPRIFGAGRLLARTPSPTGSSWRSPSARTRSSTSPRSTTSPPGSSSRTRGSGWASSSRCRAPSRRSRTRSGSCGMAATSCLSGSRRARRRSTSPSR